MSTTSTVSANIYFKKPFDINDDNLFNIKLEQLRRLKFTTNDLNVTIKSNKYSTFKNDIENLVRYNVKFNKFFLFSEKRSVDVCNKIIFQYEMMPYFETRHSRNIVYLECLFRSFNLDTTNNYTSSGYVKDIFEENNSENTITQYSYMDELGKFYYITHDENRMFLRITKCINFGISPCLISCYKLLIDRLFYIVNFQKYTELMSVDGIFPMINNSNNNDDDDYNYDGGNSDSAYSENDILNSRAFHVFELQFNSYLNCDSPHRIDENSSPNKKISLRCFDRDRIISFADQFIFAKTDWLGDKVLVLYDCKNKIVLFRNSRNEINISYIDLYFKNSIVFTATLFDKNKDFICTDYKTNNVYRYSNVYGRRVGADEETVMVVDDILSVYGNGIFWEINKSSAYLFYDAYNILKLSHYEQFAQSKSVQNALTNRIKHFKNIKYQRLTSVYYNLPKKIVYIEYVSLLKFLISLINKCVLEKHKVDDYIRNYMFDYVFSNESHDSGYDKTSFINGLVFINAPFKINENIYCINNYYCNTDVYSIKSPVHRELSINRVLYDLFQKYSGNNSRCFKFYDNYFLAKQHVCVYYFNYKYTNIDLTLLVNKNSIMFREDIVGLPNFSKLLPRKVYKFCTHNFSTATHYTGEAFNFNLLPLNLTK